MIPDTGGTTRQEGAGHVDPGPVFRRMSSDDTHYWARMLYQCRTIWYLDPSTPDALPFTVPRPDGATQPLKPMFPMNERSVLALGTPEREKQSE